MATNAPHSYDAFLRVVLTWPEVSRGVRLEWARAYTVRKHDAWCCTNYGAPEWDCNCGPTASWRTQPKLVP